jgi:hypothetical protein
MGNSQQPAHQRDGEVIAYIKREQQADVQTKRSTNSNKKVCRLFDLPSSSCAHV